jgi:hypothetical protein
LLPPTPDTTITDKWKQDPKGARASMRSSLRNLKDTAAPSDHQGNAGSLNPRSLAAVHTATATAPTLGDSSAPSALGDPRSPAAVHTAAPALAAARPRSPSISGAAAPATTTTPRPNANDTSHGYDALPPLTHRTIDEAARLSATSSHANTGDITTAKGPDGPVGPDGTIGFLSTLERTRVHALAAEVTAAIKASRIAAIASNAAEAHTAEAAIGSPTSPPSPPSRSPHLPKAT